MITIEDLAKIAHSAMHAFLLTQGQGTGKSWDDAEQWERNDVIGWVTYWLDHPDETLEIYYYNSNNTGLQWTKGSYPSLVTRKAQEILFEIVKLFRESVSR